MVEIVDYNGMSRNRTLIGKVIDNVWKLMGCCVLLDINFKYIGNLQ